MRHQGGSPWRGAWRIVHGIAGWPHKENRMLPRRRCLAMMMLALTGWATGSHAQTPSQSWPVKPVRLVVGLAPGGLVDVLARTVQPHLAEALKQTVIVENRGGAGGNVAGAEVARNGGDNHTFLLNPSTTESVNPLMFASMPFNPQRDLRPVACWPTASCSCLSGLRLASIRSKRSWSTRASGPIRSITVRPETARRRIWRASCSSRRLASRPPMHRIAAWRRRYKIWRQARSTSRLDPPRSFPWCRRAS